MSKLGQPIPDQDCRALTLKFKARGVVVLLFDAETISGASYGMTKRECREMGDLLDRLVGLLETGSVAVWAQEPRGEQLGMVLP